VPLITKRCLTSGLVLLSVWVATSLLNTPIAQARAIVVKNNTPHTLIFTKDVRYLGCIRGEQEDFELAPGQVWRAKQTLVARKMFVNPVVHDPLLDLSVPLKMIARKRGVFNIGRFQFLILQDLQKEYRSPVKNGNVLVGRTTGEWDFPTRPASCRSKKRTWHWEIAFTLERTDKRSTPLKAT
jgi:hypothetical protein